MVSSSADLTNRSQQAHGVRCKLTEASQEGHSCEIISWMHCEVDEWLQNELAMRFHVSLQCVSCELKFCTGQGPGASGVVMITGIHNYRDEIMMTAIILKIFQTPFYCNLAIYVISTYFLGFISFFSALSWKKLIKFPSRSTPAAILNSLHCRPVKHHSQLICHIPVHGS